MNDSKLKEFIKLSKEKKDLKCRLNRIDEELEKLEESLLEDFQNIGLSKITLDNSTVYIKKRLFVSPKDGNREAVLEALRESELTEFIQENFNTNTLTAYVREQFESGFKLSQSLEESLKVSEKFTLNVIKA